MINGKIVTPVSEKSFAEMQKALGGKPIPSIPVIWDLLVSVIDESLKGSNLPHAVRMWWVAMEHSMGTFLRLLFTPEHEKDLLKYCTGTKVGNWCPKCKARTQSSIGESDIQCSKCGRKWTSKDILTSIKAHHIFFTLSLTMTERDQAKEFGTVILPRYKGKPRKRSPFTLKQMRITR
jgi:hypothetical protein